MNLLKEKMKRNGCTASDLSRLSGIIEADIVAMAALKRAPTGVLCDVLLSLIPVKDPKPVPYIMWKDYVKNPRAERDRILKSHGERALKCLPKSMVSRFKSGRGNITRREIARIESAAEAVGIATTAALTEREKRQILEACKPYKLTESRLEKYLVGSIIPEGHIIKYIKLIKEQRNV